VACAERARVPVNSGAGRGGNAKARFSSSWVRAPFWCLLQVCPLMHTTSRGVTSDGRAETMTAMASRAISEVVLKSIESVGWIGLSEPTAVIRLNTVSRSRRLSVNVREVSASQSLAIGSGPCASSQAQVEIIVILIRHANSGARLSQYSPSQAKPKNH
jgi:hypothetical protein